MSLPDPFDDEDFHDDPEPGCALAILLLLLVLLVVAGMCTLAVT